MPRRPSTRTILRRLANAIADQAAANPEFDAEIRLILDQSPQDALRNRPDRSVSMKTKDIVHDPFEAWEQKREDFPAWLETLSVSELRAIVRTNGFDPARLSDRWRSKGRFIDLISRRVESRKSQGDVFLRYGEGENEDLLQR